LRTMTTKNFARDIDRLCDKLACGKWSAIYGQSYGSRLALEYARLFPKRVERLVVDGVLPLSQVGEFSQDAAINEDALRKVFAHCLAEPTCQALLGDPQATLGRAVAAVDAGKAAAPDEAGVEKVLSRDDFFDVLSFMLRVGGGAREAIPLLIADVAKEPPSTTVLRNVVKVLLEVEKQIVEDVDVTVLLVVHCNEGFRRDRSPDVDRILRDAPFFGRLGIASYEQIKARCEPLVALVPDEVVGVEIDELRSDIPACILSGEVDTATPARWAEPVTAGLTRSADALVRFGGHINAFTPCGSKITKQCLTMTTPESVDTSCAAEQESPYNFASSSYSPPHNGISLAALRATSALAPRHIFTRKPTMH